MTSSCQDSDASLNFSSPATLNFSTPTFENRELEMLIIASIQTLKQGKKKFRKDEVFRLFRDSFDDLTEETFDKLLELLIQNKSVCHTKYYWKSGMLVTPERKPEIKRK